MKIRKSVIEKSKVYSNENIVLKNVYAWKNLKLSCQTVNSNELMASYPQLKHLPITNFKNAKPRVLIGLDNSRLGCVKNWIDCPPSGPIAVETDLGWMLYGPVTGNDIIHESSVLMVNNVVDEYL